MSLLPGQILPQTAALGKVTPDGTVIIEQNWWLLLYQLCQQVLSNGQGSSSIELTELALLQPKGTDYDRKLSDLHALIMQLPNTAGRIAALERQVADLQQQVALALRMWN